MPKVHRRERADASAQLLLLANEPGDEQRIRFTGNIAQGIGDARREQSLTRRRTAGVFAVEEMIAENFKTVENHVSMNDRLRSSFEFLLLVRRLILVITRLHRVEFLRVLVVVMVMLTGRFRSVLRIGQRGGRRGIRRRMRQIVRHDD